MAPKPASRTRSTTVQRQSPARPSVRDFTGAAGGQTIEFDVRTAYDFVYSISAEAGLTDDLPVEDRRWLADSRAALPAAVKDAVPRLFQTEWCIQLGELVVQRPEARTSAELLQVLRTATPAQLLHFAFGELLSDPAHLAAVDRALNGEVAAVAEVQKALPRQHHDAWLRMLLDPEETRRQVLLVLEAWAVPFARIEDRVRGILERDVELRATDRATLDVPDLIEKTTGGVRWLPESRIRRVIMAPSYFSRPYNYLLAGDDWRLFGYPVSDDALEDRDPLAPPQGVVRLHRALGDDSRLRILKLLSRQDYYLTELAQLLELSKPTVKHHLAQLRAAGLVTAVESGGAVIYYTLRRARLDDASAELKRFLAE